MASWLAIDWDQDQFHILCVQTSRRGVQVTSAATWAHPEPFTPSTAERVGAALGDFLNAQKMPAAPVIVGLGRDRVILKELRFPPIAPHEEAALVRFQTAKELTDSADRYAIDYAYLNADKSDGDRHVLAAAARRDLVVSIQTLCQAAGLKLHAVTPRLFGAGHALVHSVAPDPSPLTPNCRNVVLTLGQRWAEMCFFRGDQIVQAQAVANGPLLVNEIKRNLAVFQAQHAVEVDLQGPGCLHLFGDAPDIVLALQTGINLPVLELDPLETAPESIARTKSPGALAGALGLAILWSSATRPPVNLAAPKKHHAPPSISAQRGIFYGAAAAVVLFLVVGMMLFVLSTKKGKLQALAAQKATLDAELKAIAPDRADLEAYKEWERTTVPWLDELYDLTARHPFEEGFHVKKFDARYIAKKKDAKDNKEYPVGRIDLVGVTPEGKERYVKELHASIRPDPHVLAAINGVRQVAGEKEYKMLIDVSKQATDKYVTQFAAPPPPKVKIIEKWKDAPKQAPAQKEAAKSAGKQEGDMQ